MTEMELNGVDMCKKHHSEALQMLRDGISGAEVAKRYKTTTRFVKILALLGLKDMYSVDILGKHEYILTKLIKNERLSIRDANWASYVLTGFADCDRSTTIRNIVIDRVITRLRNGDSIEDIQKETKKTKTQIEIYAKKYGIIAKKSMNIRMSEAAKIADEVMDRVYRQGERFEDIMEEMGLHKAACCNIKCAYLKKYNVYKMLDDTTVKICEYVIGGESYTEAGAHLWLSRTGAEVVFNKAVQHTWNCINKDAKIQGYDLSNKRIEKYRSALTPKQKQDILELRYKLTSMEEFREKTGIKIEEAQAIRVEMLKRRTMDANDIRRMDWLMRNMTCSYRVLGNRLMFDLKEMYPEVVNVLINTYGNIIGNKASSYRVRIMSPAFDSQEELNKMIRYIQKSLRA